MRKDASGVRRTARRAQHRSVCHSHSRSRRNDAPSNDRIPGQRNLTTSSSAAAESRAPSCCPRTSVPEGAVASATRGLDGAGTADRCGSPCRESPSPSLLPPSLSLYTLQPSEHQPVYPEGASVSPYTARSTVASPSPSLPLSLPSLRQPTHCTPASRSYPKHVPVVLSPHMRLALSSRRAPPPPPPPPPPGPQYRPAQNVNPQHSQNNANFRSNPREKPANSRRSEGCTELTGSVFRTPNDSNPACGQAGSGCINVIESTMNANFRTNLRTNVSDSRWSEGFTVFISQFYILQTNPIHRRLGNVGCDVTSSLETGQRRTVRPLVVNRNRSAVENDHE